MSEGRPGPYELRSDMRMERVNVKPGETAEVVIRQAE